MPTCSRCGKPLKDPLSIALGMGPDCRGDSFHTGADSHVHQSGHHDSAYGLPGGGAAKLILPVSVETHDFDPTICLVDINLFDPNPYQTRFEISILVVLKLARSILEHGLRHPIGARPHPEQLGRYQISSGHTRTEAYRLLAEHGYGVAAIDFEAEPLPLEWLAQAPGLPLFARIPVFIHDLTDEGMYDEAVAENADRSDLDVIEIARAMQVGINQFGRSSAQVGKQFGVSGSVVRNMTRYLTLPDEVQALMREGKITQNAARRLLTMQRTVPTKVVETAKTIAQGGLSNPAHEESFIRSQISSGKDTQRMVSPWDYERRSDRANDLFTFDWKVGGLKLPTWGQFKKLYEGPESFEGMLDLKEIFESAVLAFDRGETAEKIIESGIPEEVVNAIQHLLNPPTCTRCPFYIVINKEVFCGRKTCYERKVEAWMRAELGRLVAETGIPAYDSETDGPYFERPGGYSQWPEAWKKKFEERDSNLRLIIDKNYYGTNGLGSNVVNICSISKESQEKGRLQIEAKKSQEAAEELRHKEGQERWRGDQREKASAVLVEKAGQCLGPQMFKRLSIGTLELMYQQARHVRPTYPEGQTPLQKKQWLMGEMGKNLIGHYYIVPNEIKRLGPVECAKHLMGMANEVGGELPDNWMAMANDLVPDFDRVAPVAEPRSDEGEGEEETGELSYVSIEE